MAGKQQRDEDRIQRAIVQYGRWALKPKHMIFSVPNGGQRPRIEAAIMVGLGLMKGVFDLCILGPGGQSWWLEVKGPNGNLTPEQEEFCVYAIGAGVPYAIVHSLDEAMEAMKSWKVVR